ncbi:LOW QUALITY PROTEIN: galanin receptor type 1, partial [Spinachia spinachia]
NCTTNIFILNLRVADYLLFGVPFQSTIYMLPTFICRFIHYFHRVHFPAVVAYVVIVHARKSYSIRVWKLAMLGVVLIWILSLVMAAPVGHYQSIVEREVHNPFCWEVWPDHHITQDCLVVVVVFCLSWLPHHIVPWVEFGSFPLNPASFVFRVVAHCLAYSNSSVHPIIYPFLSENFRKSYKQVFWCRRTPSGARRSSWMEEQSLLQAHAKLALG